MVNEKLLDKLEALLNIIAPEGSNETVRLSFGGDPVKVTKIYRELEPLALGGSISKNFLNTIGDTEICVTGLRKEMDCLLILATYAEYFTREKICISNSDKSEYLLYSQF